MHLNLKGGVRIVLPDNLKLITVYVALEQEDWFENYNNDKNLSPSLQIHNGLLLSEEVGDSLSLSVSKLV